MGSSRAVCNTRFDLLLALWPRRTWAGGGCDGCCGEAGWADRRCGAGGHPVSALAVSSGDGDFLGEGVGGEADSQGPMLSNELIGNLQASEASSAGWGAGSSEGPFRRRRWRCTHVYILGNPALLAAVSSSNAYTTRPE